MIINVFDKLIGALKSRIRTRRVFVNWQNINYENALKVK